MSSAPIQATPPVFEPHAEFRDRGRHPDLEWARSGAMALTGFADGPPLLAPAPLAARARDVVRALGEIARASRLPGAAALDGIDGGALLGERAACAGFTRRGQISPGGACRLIRCADAWIAVNLARADDVALVAAWLEENVTAEPFELIAVRARTRAAGELVDRARLLGMPVAHVAAPPQSAPPWLRIPERGARAASRVPRPPLVLDLSSLWAGPLAAHLLAAAGARVVKVESTRRADGARYGPARFYDLLNAGKQSVALDFRATEGCRLLHALVARADVVIESSRPRALAQLGIDAAGLVRTCPGLVWVSITGYGRAEPMASWAAFGDDAAAASGLVLAMGARAGAPVFCADAIADPLTGMHAALAALAAWRDGQSVLLDVALRDVVANVFAQPSRAASAGVGRVSPRHGARPVSEYGERRTCEGADSAWEVVAGGDCEAVSPPRARDGTGRARPLGADTAAVLAGFDLAC
jgi:crotonobetainyl-CoA:carnitine CoA-transferase CaiB-like acyl-CoA transferase